MDRSTKTIVKSKIRPHKLHWFTWVALTDLENRWIGFTGGVGSGKSEGGVIWHYHRCRMNHRSQFSWVVSPTYAKLFDSIIPRYRRILESFGYVHGQHFEMFKTPIAILRFLYSGHTIHFHGADRPDLMVATEISHVLIEEPGRMKGQVFIELEERLRCKNATINQGLLTGVPQGINSYAEMFDF